MEVDQVVMYWDPMDKRWCPSLVLDLYDGEIVLDVDHDREDGYELGEQLSVLSVQTDDEGVVWLRYKGR